MNNPEKLTQQPEPMLVGFLKRYHLYIAKEVDGAIQVQGIDRINREGKIVGRKITVDEIETVTDWIKKNSHEIEASPLLNWNMKAFKTFESAKKPNG